MDTSVASAVFASSSAAHATAGMDVLDAIYGRRATRAFTTQTVDVRTVRALLDAANQAPSAMNLQPWAFVIVQDALLMRGISDRAKQLSLANLHPGTPLWERRQMLADPLFNVFYDAGTLIVVCATNGPGHPAEDVCLAAQNLMLAAHALGLGTCPIGFARDALNERLAKQRLGIPDDHSVILPIVVGYPRDHPIAPKRREARVLSWN